MLYFFYSMDKSIEQHHEYTAQWYLLAPFFFLLLIIQQLIF